MVFALNSELDSGVHCPGLAVFDVVKDLAVKFHCGSEEFPGVNAPLMAFVLGCLEKLHVDDKTGNVRIAKKSLPAEVGVLLPRILNFLCNRSQCPSSEEVVIEWRQTHAYNPEMDTNVDQGQRPAAGRQRSRRAPLKPVGSMEDGYSFTDSTQREEEDDDDDNE